MNIVNIFLESEFKVEKTALLIAEQFFSGETNPMFHATKAIKKEMSLITDVNIAKKLAVKFDGQHLLVDMEDVLCELIGDDAYCDFAEDNDLT